MAGLIITPPTFATSDDIAQLSFVTGLPKLAVVLQLPGPSSLVLTVIFARQVIVGTVLSTTVTVNWQVDELLQASVNR